MSTDQSARALPARDHRSALVVSALADRGLLVPGRHAEAVAVVDAALGSQRAPATPLRRRFAELAGYLGAAFVVSAAGIFLAAQWPDLTDDQRVGLLAGTAAVLAVAGVAVGGLGSGFGPMHAGAEVVRRSLASVLLLGSGFAAGAAFAVQVSRDADPSSVLPPLVGFGTFTVFALGGYLFAPTAFGQAALAFGLVVTTPLAFDHFGDVEPLAYGLIILALGVAWLVLAERGVWREVATARILGCALAVFGAQFPVSASEDRWVSYLLLALVATAAFTVYVSRSAWPYVAAGVIAVTLAVPEALLDWTEGALGPAGVLLVAGVTLLGASMLGLRLRQESSVEASD